MTTQLDGTTAAGLAALADLRARFLDDPATDLSGLRPVIARSWRRSRAAGVDAHDTRQPLEPSPVDETTWDAAAPHLEDLQRFAGTHGGYVTLVSPGGALVHSEAEDHLDFPLGLSLLEECCGTNSDGTALEEGTGLWVFSREHYRDDMQSTTCFSALVKDPFRRDVRACLGLTLPEDVVLHTDPRSISMVLAAAAARIADDVTARIAVREQALLTKYLETCRKLRNPVVVAMDGRHNIVSHSAASLLGDGDFAVISGYVLQALREEQAGVHRLTAAGLGDVSLDIEIVDVSGRTAGAVAVLRTEGTEPAVAPPQLVTAGVRSPEPVATYAGQVGRSPAFRRMLDQVSAAESRALPTHVEGEPGSGRRALARAIARAWDPAEPLELDCSSATDVLEHLARASADGRAVVLLDLEALPPGELRRLREAARTVRGARVVATVARPSGRAARLLADWHSFEVSVPALRTRRDDIPLLAEQAAREVCDLTLTDRLVGALAQAEWPGNVEQLRAVVQHAAVAARAAGASEVRLDDVPRSSLRRASSSTLTRLEEAEIDAIASAMEDCDGNRSQAAELLGASRSTLYRRLDYFARRGIRVD